MKGIILNLETLEKVKSLNIVTTKYSFIAINEHGKAIFRNRETQKLKEIKIPYIEDQIVYVKEKYYLEKALDNHTLAKAMKISTDIAFEGENATFITGKSRPASSLNAAMARKKARVVNVQVRPTNDDLTRRLNFWRVVYHFEVI